MRGLRTFLRRAAIVGALLLLLGLLVGGLAVRRPPRFVAEEVERLIAAAIHPDTPPQVRIGRLRVDLTGPALLLEDIRIASRPGIEPAVRIEAARFDVAISGLWPPLVDVTRVTLVRPRVTWSEHIGLVLLRGPARSESTRPFPALRVVDGSVEGEFPDVGWLQAREVEIDAAADSPGGIYRARLSLLVPSAGRLRAEGHVDPAGKSYAAFVEGDALEPNPKDLPWLSERARALTEKLEPKGSLDLRAAIAGEFSGTPRIGGAVRFRDLSLRIPDLEPRLDSASGLARLDAQGNLHARARGVMRGAAIDVEAFARDILSGDPDVWIATSTPVVVSYEPWVRDVFIAIDGPYGELDAFAARGRGTVDLFLSRRKGDEVFLAAVDIDVVDAQGSYVGFPGDIVSFAYPLVDVRGRFSYRRGTLLVSDVRGRGPTGPIGLDGLFRFASGKSPGLDFSATMENARIDEDLDRAVRGLPEVGAIWADLSPTAGRVDAAVRIAKTLAEPRLSTRGELRVSGAEARYAGFPLPTGDLEGLIGLADEGVAFRFDGIADPRGASRAHFELEGAVSRFRVGELGRAGLGIEVHAQDLRFGPALESALSTVDPAVAATLAEIRYDGPFDAHARILRPAGIEEAGLASDIEINLRGGTLTRVGLGSSLQEARGTFVVNHTPRRAEAQGDEVHGWAIGRVAATENEADSTERPRGFGDGLLALEARTHELGLDIELQADIVHASPEDLRRAIDRAEDLPAIREIDLEGGGVDADLTLVHRAGQKPELSAELDFVGVDVQVEGWIAPLRDLRGQIAVLPYGEFLSDELLLEVPHEKGDGSTHVALHEVRIESSGSAIRARAEAAIENLALDRHLETFLGRAGAARILEWKGTGKARSEGLQVNLAYPRTRDGEIGAPRVEFRGRIFLEDVHLDPGVAIDGITAQLDVVRGRVGPLGVEEIEAEATNGKLRIFGIALDRIATRLRLDPQAFRTTRRASAQVLGGELTPLRSDGPDEPPTFALDLTGEHAQLAVNLRVKGAALQRLLSEVQGTSTRAPGTFDATLELTGPVNDVSRLRGHSRFEVEDGELGTLPVLGRLNPLLGQDAVTFRAAQAEARLEGLIVHVDELHLDSEAAELSGSGAVGLDGTVALAIDITYLDVLGIPIFGSILAHGLGMILSATPLVHIEVAGWIDDPRIYPQFGPTGRRALKLQPRPYVPSRIRPSFSRRF